MWVDPRPSSDWTWDDVFQMLVGFGGIALSLGVLALLLALAVRLGCNAPDAKDQEEKGPEA